MINSDATLKSKPTNNKQKFSDKLVAFIDILGFRELVLRNTSDALKTLKVIDNTIRHVLNVLKDSHGQVYSTKLFSDCICISCEYSSENIFFMLYELAFIQFNFAQDGIFLRGGFSRGLHFENNRLIFSQGLISAYDLEQTAKYPRIIINKTLVDDIKNDDSSYCPTYIEFKKKDLLIESPDGQFFVDYLNILMEPGIDQLESFSNHKKSVILNVNANINNTAVVEKYRWLAEYHNNKFKEYFSENTYTEKDAATVVKETTINIETEFPQFKKLQ